jgi:hypothetical protein
LEVLNEEGRFEYLQKGEISPAGKDDSETYIKYRLGFVTSVPENPDGILNVGGDE